MDRYPLTYKVSYDGGQNWIDITDIVDSASTVIEQHLCSTKYMSVKDKASFRMPPKDTGKKQTFINNLFGTGDILVRISEGQTVRFTGVVDKSEANISSSRLTAELTVSCQDLSALRLDSKVSSHVFLENRTISQIVFHLLGLAQYTYDSTKVIASNEERTLKAFVIDADNADTYRKYIDELLFEAGGYVLNFTESGIAEIVRLPWDNMQTARVLDNKLSAKGLNTKSTYLEEDGVKVKWSTLDESASDQNVYLDNISRSVDGEGNLVGEDIVNGGYWPQDGDVIKTYQEFSADFLDKPYLYQESRVRNEDLSIIAVKDVYAYIQATNPDGSKFTNWTYPVLPSLGMTGNPEIWPTKAWYLLRNDSGKTVNLQFFTLKGTVIYRNRINEILAPSASANPKEYTSKYIFSEAHAKHFSNFYWHFMSQGRYVSTWAEVNNGTLGESVTVKHKGNDRGQNVVVVSKKSTWLNHDTEICEMTGVAISAFNAFAVQQTSTLVGTKPSSQTGKDGVGILTERTYYSANDTEEAPRDWHYTQDLDGKNLWTKSLTVYTDGTETVDASEQMSKRSPVDGIVEVSEVRGKTVVWNQLEQISSEGHYLSFGSNVQHSNGITSLVAVNQSGRVYNHSGYRPTLVEGHVYMHTLDLKGTTATNLVQFYQMEEYRNVDLTTTWKNFNDIKKFSSSLSSIVLVRDMRASGWDTIYIRNWFRIDLTTLFGVTEVSQVTDSMKAFVKAYADAHPQYDAGSLVSASNVKVRSEGAVLWKNGSMSNEFFTNATGSTQSDNGYRLTEFIDTKGASSISVSFAKTVIFYDSSKNVISGVFKSASVFRNVDLPSGTHFIRFDNIASSVAGNDIIVARGTYSQDRLPKDYRAPSTLDLSFLSSVPDIGMEGTVIDFEKKEVMWTYGKVDLGSLNWTRGGNGYYYSRLPSVMARPVNTSTIGNMVSTLPIKSQSDFESVENGLAYFWTSSTEDISRIVIHNTTVADRVAMKESLNGVMLIYEISTPIVKSFAELGLADSSPMLPIEAGGTASLVSDVVLPNTMVFSDATYVENDAITGVVGADGQKGQDADSWFVSLAMSAYKNGTFTISVYKNGALSTTPVYNNTWYMEVNKSAWVSSSIGSEAITGTYTRTYTDIKAYKVDIYADSAKTQFLCSNVVSIGDTGAKGDTGNSEGTFLGLKDSEPTSGMVLHDTYTLRSTGMTYECNGSTWVECTDYKKLMTALGGILEYNSNTDTPIQLSSISDSNTVSFFRTIVVQEGWFNDIHTKNAYMDDAYVSGKFTSDALETLDAQEARSLTNGTINWVVNSEGTFMIAPISDFVSIFGTEDFTSVRFAQGTVNINGYDFVLSDDLYYIVSWHCDVQNNEYELKFVRFSSRQYDSGWSSVNSNIYDGIKHDHIAVVRNTGLGSARFKGVTNVTTEKTEAGMLTKSLVPKSAGNFDLGTLDNYYKEAFIETITNSEIKTGLINFGGGKYLGIESGSGQPWSGALGFWGKFHCDEVYATKVWGAVFN